MAKPRVQFTADEIVDWLDGYFASAALGAALETQLFWTLAEKPLDASGVARELGIADRPCRYWLQVLTDAKFLLETDGRYLVPDGVRRAITDRYSRQSWSMLAELARHRYPALCDLPQLLKQQGGADRSVGLSPTEVASDPELARRFTRMLYEFHLGFADAVANSLDLTDVRRVVDLGGGSGVVSMAIVRRNPSIAAVVAELGHVCSAGREIAVQNGLDDRVEFRSVDLVRDDLPAEADLMIECDVGAYTKSLFQRIGSALAPQGRYVIVDKLAPAPGVAPQSRAHWALLRSLANPTFTYSTASELVCLAATCGLKHISSRPLPDDPRDTARFSAGFTILEFAQSQATP